MQRGRLESTKAITVEPFRVLRVVAAEHLVPEGTMPSAASAHEAALGGGIGLYDRINRQGSGCC